MKYLILNKKIIRIYLLHGGKKNFKNKIFKDYLLNVDSNIKQKSLFFVIYLEKNLPKFIPKM